MTSIFLENRQFSPKSMLIMNRICTVNNATNNAKINANYAENGVKNTRYLTPLITRIKTKATGDEVGCVVLELGYFIAFEDKALEDPFSVVLSLTEEEKQDERIKISIDEMLEEYVW